MKRNYGPKGVGNIPKTNSLDLEHRNLLIAILVEDLLSDKRKQTEKTDGWMDQLFEVILVAV